MQWKFLAYNHVYQHINHSSSPYVLEHNTFLQQFDVHCVKTFFSEKKKNF